MTDSTDNARGRELKPCPFCGGEAEIWRAQQGRTAWIGCMGRCSVLVSKEYKTDAEAIAAWNRRADLAHDPQDARVVALVEALVDAASHLRIIAGMNLMSGSSVAYNAARKAEAALAAFDKGGKDE